MECYESLHKCSGYWDIVISDEVHHIGSKLRLELMQGIQFGYFIGLSATIPLKLKQYFKYRYHAQVVSCDIIEAIEDNILPEPTILLFPLKVENTRQSETIEINPKASGSIVYGEYKDLWKCKRNKVHAILRCTQRQKLDELNKMIDWFKDKTMLTNNPAMKQSWLHFCGKRLEFLADCKLQWVKMILQHLSKERTITFCKTIAQTEELGKNCIHSQNKLATKIYDDFNSGKINHITAVNRIVIGDNLLTGRFVLITDNSHGSFRKDELSIHPSSRPITSKGEVIIGNNVWLGDKVSILPGVHIGDGCIIGANSVVTHSIPPFSIAAGNPAKILNTIKE
jgi:acetyltransferase-like isoleucine patch superfamily enzyme